MWEKVSFKSETKRTEGDLWISIYRVGNGSKNYPIGNFLARISTGCYEALGQPSLVSVFINKKKGLIGIGKCEKDNLSGMKVTMDKKKARSGTFTFSLVIKEIGKPLIGKYVAKLNKEIVVFSFPY